MTWFKVDDSFYDHPKAFDASDGAVALWVRAGTWSARNLTGGFVPTARIAGLCQDPATSAAELVRRGLWSKTRGGYQFHDWHDFQPSKEQVEGERKSNAERQRRWRENQRNANRNAVINTVSNGAPDPTRPDHKGGSSKTDRYVARDLISEPPPKCPKHLDDPDPPPCGPCADARRTNEAWTAQEAERRRQLDLLARSTTAKERAEAHRLAIDACHRCDQEGKIAGRPCPHTDPPARIRTGRVEGLRRERADPVARARQRAEPSILDAATADLPPLSQPPDDGDPPPLAEVVPIRPATTEEP